MHQVLFEITTLQKSKKAKKQKSKKAKKQKNKKIKNKILNMAWGVSGLVSRRISERNLFLNNMYDSSR
ncbi:hypothetical protein [Yersinia wautersii]|uniref:hypothetical protein n=1 Tax=Yersinia wautersii TaxID=1341643 RepID=UPI00040D696D|nr:hypothetical protein [Yersinia wautersii]